MVAVCATAAQPAIGDAGRGRNRHRSRRQRCAGHGHVLGDASGRFLPHEWARTPVPSYRTHSAARIVAEVSNDLTGRIARPGSLLRSATAARWSKRTIRMVEPNVPFTQARASRGKVTRAEPVAALYEQGRVQIRPTASTRSFGPFRSSWSSRSPIRDCLILSVARWRDRRGGLCGRCSRDRASRGQVDRRRRRISSEATEAR